MIESTRIYDEPEASGHTKISRRTLQRMRRDGGGPPFVRLGARRVGYPAAALAQWIAARTYPHRAAELAQQPQRAA